MRQNLIEKSDDGNEDEDEDEDIQIAKAESLETEIKVSKFKGCLSLVKNSFKRICICTKVMITRKNKAPRALSVSQ